MTTHPDTIERPVIASRDTWLTARLALLEREKALSKAVDEVARLRRSLPWVRVDKTYAFETPDGRQTLADLFDGRPQLLIQHFMLGPGWPAGCPSCSFMADHLDGAAPHLAARGISLRVVSRAPLPEIQRFHQRMGWQFHWVSSFGSDFNTDFGVSFTPEAIAAGAVDYNYGRRPFGSTEAPGISVFQQDAGEIYHSYSCYGRGVEAMMGAYPLIDLTATGRNEAGLDYSMAWVRHHDRYPEDSGRLTPRMQAASPAATSAASPANTATATASGPDSTASAQPASGSCCHGRKT